ncbi:hypothetical protein GS620_08920 [Ruegeria sp. HKCCD6428]|nr:hypothetical protein [Ruegeria sp. HKCCD6428]
MRSSAVAGCGEGRIVAESLELQGYFRAADGYFAADHTSFWGAKVG